MTARTMYARTILLTVCAVWPVVARGQHACCQDCGNLSAVRAICRPVCTTRIVETTTWDTLEEHVCTSGVCPDSCKLRPRNRLMRKTVRQEVPIVVWTVEYACELCARRRAAGPFTHQREPAELSHYFPSPAASMQQWSGAVGEPQSVVPRRQSPANPFNGLIRAVRDYVERQ